MRINDFLTKYEEGEVTVSNGVTYNTRDIIEDAYRTYNGKFESELDSSGLKKFFFRMIWVIYRTIIMSSDIDLKDMNMRSLNGEGINTLALVKLATRSHLLRTGFGKYIDRVMSDMVWFGSSVTKRVNGSIESVDLRNYVTTTNIREPQEREHAERVFYSYEQMKANKDKWEDSWQDIEDLYEAMKKANEHRFKVIEFWTWDEMDGENHKVCIKYLDRSEYNPEDAPDPSDWSPHLELEKFITPYKKRRNSKFLRDKLGDEEEMFPYEQADFFECPGRWISMGCSELLSELNEMYQETGNNKRKMDLLGLRSIFVHKYSNDSNSLTQDFLDNLETGAVLSMDENEDLQRLVIDTKTSEFLNSMDKLYELMRLVMGVTAQGTGEELPGSTSATGVKANFATQQTTYDFVRERMHHFLQTLFMNGYFSDIIDEVTREQMVAITGSPKDLMEIDKKLVQVDRQRATKERYNQLVASRETEDMPGFVTWDEAEALDQLEEAETKELVEQFKQMGDTRWANIKKELLKYLDYTIEFFVNNETFDKQAKLENLRMMLQDPNFQGSRQAVQDAIFDLTNENPRAFDKTREEIQQEQEMMMQQQMQEQEASKTPAPITL